MSIKTNVMIVKSNPSSNQPKNVARKTFHCGLLISRHQGRLASGFIAVEISNASGGLAS
jgi:hypothetical protein